MGYENGADEFALPIEDDIEKAIKQGTPLLTNVNTVALPKNTKLNLNAKGGHWMVIVGIDKNDNKIAVFDPAEGKIVTVDYDSEEYKNKTYSAEMYWQNTSYVDPK